MNPEQPSLDSLDFSAFETCLMHVSAHLERPLTAATLFAAQSDPSGTLTIRDGLEAARKVGLQAGYGQWKLSDFDESLSPALLLMNGNRAVVYYGRSEAGRFLIFDPTKGEEIAEVSEALLAPAYTGYAILLRRSYTADPLNKGQSLSGHWFWSAMIANRWSYAQVALAAVVANLLGLSTSVFIMVVYDRVLPNEATESLVALTIGVGLALVFDFALKVLRAGFIDRAGQKADMLTGRRVFDHLLSIRMKSRTGSTGAMVNTVREFETLREFFTSATLVALVDLPFVVLFILVIHAIGGPLAIVPALAVPIVLVTGLAVQPLLSHLAEKSFADGQSKQSVLVEAISGLETIKTTAAARQMRSRWETAMERQSAHGTRSRTVTQFALNLTGFTQQAAQVLIVFYGVFLITNGQTSMGALVASVMLTGRALAPLGQLAQTLTRINQARSAYRGLNTLMQSDSERPDGQTWVSRSEFDGHISFSGRAVLVFRPNRGLLERGVF